MSTSAGDRRPLVSVLMPLYQGERHVESSVRSILSQTMADLELVVVDDGSTDAGPDIVRSIADDRVRVVSQDNAGAAAARNTAVRSARGSFLAWQDADDVSLPHRLERLLQCFTSEDVGFAHSDMVMVDEQGSPLSYWPSRNIPRSSVLRVLVREGSPYNSISMMLRRQVLDGRSFRSFRACEDTDMISQFADRWTGVHVPEPLVLYRRHATNSTNGRVDVGPMVEALVAARPLQELVPEAYCSDLDPAEADALASAVLGLCFVRRGIVDQGLSHFEVAAATPSGPAVRTLVAGLGRLAARDGAGAVEMLSSCPPVTATSLQALQLNYLGEACALLGHAQDAYRAFLQADALAPQYPEPRNNLRCLAGGPGPRFAF